MDTKEEEFDNFAKSCSTSKDAKQYDNFFVHQKTHRRC